MQHGSQFGVDLCRADRLCGDPAGWGVAQTVGVREQRVV
jgi:hypothetical protein